MRTPSLKSPYPWPGGKSRVADLIWARLGDVPVFVDPFFGSNAVLLCRPHSPRIETINDKDSMVGNVWRAIKHDPDAVAFYAADLISEVDLHARHSWLVRQRPDLTERLMGDMDYYDARIAGLWLWGICCWIGSGWCSGRGPWQSVDGRLVKVPGEGIERTRPQLRDEGMGVHRVSLLPQEGELAGVSRKLPFLGGDGKGTQAGGVARQARRLSGNNGINQQTPFLAGNPGRTWCGHGVHTERASGSGLQDWMRALSDRLRRVRVCCGDWERVLGPAGTVHIGTTGVLLDPPYKHSDRDDDLYAVDEDVWEAARAWAVEHGSDRRFRIVLCGYSDDPASVMPGGGPGTPGKAGAVMAARARAGAERMPRGKCCGFRPGALGLNNHHYLRRLSHDHSRTDHQPRLALPHLAR